ncbi:15693_t:CDS:2 [Racocetra fulgida]|uniref:15693_t:CDS:1 n=1 Tax=Racocetra fulgida TaxID=60492 RepID=A0A9N8ZKR9_9GLOM|nr:15693_t:CDS:2 [Racocetra fulgida]
MIETVDNRDELIKYSFDILWKATDGKIILVTFKENPLFTVTFNLNDGTSKTLNLDASKVVLITRENFIKILRDIEQNEKEIAINDDEEPSNSLTERGIQESAQNSSFDVEEDSTLHLISIPSRLKEKKITKRDETQALETNTQESRQHADTLSDEYSNTDEENDELNFDAALTLMHEAKETSKFTNRHQFKINSKFKAAKKDERFNKNSSSNKKAKERMEYTSSELSDADPDKCESLNTNIAVEESQASGWLQNSNKMMNLLQTSNDLEEIEYEHTNTNQKPSVTQSNNPSKKTNPNIINAETSIVESNRNNVLSISSIINNQQEISTSNINELNPSDELMDYQVMNRQFQW